MLVSLASTLCMSDLAHGNICSHLRDSHVLSDAPKCRDLHSFNITSGSHTPGAATGRATHCSSCLYLVATSADSGCARWLMLAACLPAHRTFGAVSDSHSEQ